MFLFIHLFIHSFSCALTQPTLHSTSFLAIYSRSFKRPKKKLWTCSKETRPKHPEEPFCLTFIHSCYFSSVPPESIWQTQWKKKKRLWGKKNNKSFLSHPHPICCGIISFYYLQIMCADMIFTVWSCGRCGCCLSCFFVCGRLWYETATGEESSPVCI